MPHPLHFFCQLRRRGGLPGAVQTNEQDHGWWPGGHGQGTMRFAHQSCQLVADDFDHLLPWGQTAHDLLPQSLLPHALYKVLDDLEVDVCLQEGEAHLTHRFLNVRFRQLSTPA